MARFDVVVESSKVGVRKPEPRFYEIACELLGVDPAECVFLDDLGVNLKPARAMGMTTIKVADPARGHRRALRPPRPRPHRPLTPFLYGFPATRGQKPVQEPACAAGKRYENVSSIRSANSWSWIAFEPVAGLPDSTRATWRMS